jgi:hypothetical protein
MENEFTKKEAKNHKEASEQGVKQTLEKYWFSCELLCLEKKMETMGEEGFLME